MCVIFNSATAQSFVTVRLVIALDPLLSTACQNSSPALVWRLGQRSSEGKNTARVRIQMVLGQIAQGEKAVVI